MFHDFTYPQVLAASARAAWQIEDVLPPDARLDFGRPFLPEGLARIDGHDFLDAREKRILNQIRGHEYLSLFGLVEEFILPFILDHARDQLEEEDETVRALLGFAGEEAKHIHLFRLFHQRFVQGFGTPCGIIGPADAIARNILSHDPLAVALLILHIEWMTQSHYLESVRGDVGIDPLFKSLLRHHWIEEAQHAKLDTLMVEALADERDSGSIADAVDQYLEIGAFLDGGLKAQAEFNIAAFEAATGRTLECRDRAGLLREQHQALRWTYIGSGMTHPKFADTLHAIAPGPAEKVREIAPVFC